MAEEASPAGAARRPEDAAPTKPESEREPETVRFRSKKRKIGYRQRADDDDDDAAPVAPRSTTFTATSDAPPKADSASPRPDAHDAAPASSSSSSQEESAVAAALRLRNARRARPRVGVGLASSSHPADEGPGSSSSRGLVPRGANAEADEDARPSLRGIGDRFTHQTGLVASLNDRHIRTAPSQGSASHPLDGEEPHHVPSRTGPSSSIKAVTEQPAKHGKLLEVQVPDRVWDRRDEAQRLRAEKAAAAGPSSKPRRGRNRRGSDDIKRDQLVEQFLHENRLDVYDVPTPAPPRPSAPGDDTSADDRMAEQFRQQYLDEMAQRRQRKRPAQPASRQQQPQGDVLKGPKLGGSRNQRAAVRDALLKQEKEKAGKRF
ncbi:hypothetical protein Purlil1_2604 [Purpureocillium lilacinum]|uniref:mRNA splicing factor RNA helicase n=1 Tax=Purpureocillium lilacinum TaxID=33203 RepID=A0ABR0CB87_PURLI|nr:hypothetical protein Purlil1_2604 [Purpureocillium lilacinum]